MSEAVAAIQTGDIPALERQLDADPELLHRRLNGYGDHGDYFRDPKLLWFVADNPNLIEVVPANSVELTRARSRVRARSTSRSPTKSWARSRSCCGAGIG